MKILLLKPIADLYYVIQPNLGLGYLATIMMKYGHQVQIMDSGRERLDWNKFTRMIQEQQYDLIGIQMYTHDLPAVKIHTDIIKKHQPSCITMVGGAHISGDPEGTMTWLTNIDFGFAGEGEMGIEKFSQLTKGDLSKPELLAQIPNLVWRKVGKVILNPRESIQDLDTIEFPAWHLMPPSSYPVAPHGSFCRKTPVAPIIVSRGCPFQCTFCAGKSVTGNRIRYRSIDNVIEEIQMLCDKFDVREIHIEDDNFTLHRDYVVEFCNKIIGLNLDIVFALPNGIRLDTLDADLLILMEKAGFYSMAVGIESGSDRVLQLMKKNTTVDLVKEKITLIKKHTRIHITGFFLMGYPGETEAEIQETIQLAKSLQINKASFLFVMPLPGSALWDSYAQNTGNVIEWGNFLYYRIVPGLSAIPEKILRKLHRKAIYGFYFRPRIVFGLLKEIRTASQLKILIKRFIDIFISRYTRKKYIVQ